MTAPVRIENTPYQRSDVVRVITKAYPRGETCVTGVIVGRHADTTVVRLYSAGCLHDDYTINNDEILRLEKY